MDFRKDDPDRPCAGTSPAYGSTAPRVATAAAAAAHRVQRQRLRCILNEALTLLERIEVEDRAEASSH
jgi:hypothetical protein